jgi:hypothetical protein
MKNEEIKINEYEVRQVEAAPEGASKSVIGKGTTFKVS